MRERVSDWEHLPDYWNVHDVDRAAPADALRLPAEEIQKLLVRFREAPV